MNKVILTDSRLFMSVVGPSGCGKSLLIYKMLAGTTFYPKFENIYFFYQEYQPLYDMMKRSLNIEFISCIDFEMISKLTDCLLVFDDSCEEIYEKKEFLKIATAGRHKKLAVIYVKHNLFHQSKNSRTIDLNTTHVIIFKSPRDINQIAYFGKQINKPLFLKEAFEKATAGDAFGHLIIDFDPRTTESLRFASNICGPSPSIFYIPSAKAVESTLGDERERLAYTRALYKA
jgi:ABC-type dipeptide/oligopeptide/nickel transport system ATPase component